MKNLDRERKKEAEIQNKLKEAIESGDSEEFAKVQVELAKGIEASILQDAKQAINEDINDVRVMQKRGLQPLTSTEKAYYNDVIGKEGFDGVEKLVPATVFERVFEDLKATHELLNEIAFVNTTGITEWITREGDVEAAWWGELTDKIEKKLKAAFKKEKTELYKLSAYVPVAKAMLDLGPEWLDRFVREILMESLAIALELAIVNGDGNGEPIGMTRDLDGAVTGGVYPEKDKEELLDLKPKSLGAKIMAPLTKEGTRVVDQVLIVVNPLDYWEKIFAQTTLLTADKTYVYGVLPIPAKVVQSVAVEKGTMIAGMPKDYFMGVGSTQVIEHSDHYRFLEDERTYIAKQYANGKPTNNDSFLVFDIEEMGEEIPEVEIPEA